MPHLAPIMWILMPLFITLMFYMQMIMLHFQQPSSFPHIKIKTYLMSNWKW